MQNAIIVKNLSKNFKVREKQPGLSGSLKALLWPKYRLIKAVEGVDFSVKEGEIVGFIGPNGAGKTTTLKMLSGILYPGSGSIQVLGHTPSKREHIFLKQISMVMGQKSQLFWDLPAIDSFSLYKAIYEISDKAYRSAFDELVELFELQEILNQQVRRLSLGQRMKCELAVSLLHTPKIIFLDEPTIGLDIITQKKLRDFIKIYNKRNNTTVILTSHNMEDVKEVAQRIIIIDKGRLVFDDRLTALNKIYADYKLIKITLNQPAQENILKKLGYEIEYAFPQLKLKVPAFEIAQVSSKLFKTLSIDDIDISEPKLEDIVSQIFEKK